MKISVIGLGYIGLPNALLLARAGHEVIGVDINDGIVEKLKGGVLPFDEPGLQKLFEEAKLKFKAQSMVESSDCYIIAVPTPLDSEMKIANLKSVKAASEAIAPHLKKDDLVILESTVPPGTSVNYVIPLLSKGKEREFLYAHCPERAIPGKTLTEMCNNDRILGGIDDQSRSAAIELYSGFSSGKLYACDVTTAEYVKLMENTYRDVNIALANEFALIAEEIGVDVWKAIELANKHPRVDILKPGPGVGGHCIAIDPLFMLAKTSNARLIPLAREINDSMAIHVVKHAKEMLKGITNPTITLLGLAYKANVDDTRESPAFKVARIAETEGMNVRVFDPLIKDFDGNYGDIEAAAMQSDCLILVTDHDDFRSIDPSSLQMRNFNIIDTRGIIDLDLWLKNGFNCKRIGLNE